MTGAVPGTRRGRARLFGGAVGVCLVLSACTASDDTASSAAAYTVRDSAAVTIVENGIASPVVHDVGAPLLDLGSVDGPPEMLFAGVGAVALLNDGRVGVADRSNRLRFYEADGHYFGSFGREGDGPGEFRRISGFWERMDGALVVFDGQSWRVTVVEGGVTAETYPVRPPGLNAPRSAAMLEDGTVVVAERLFDIPESGFEPLTTIVRRVTLDTLPPDTIRSIAGERFGPIVLEGGGRMAGSPLFEPPVSVGAAADRIVTSDCRTPEVHELAPDGSPSRIIRWTVADRAVTPSAIEAHRVERIDRADTEEGKRIAASVFEALLPLNDVVPACANIHVVDAETLWVRDYPLIAGAPDTWRVFADGRLVGSVRLPAGATLRDVRGDRLATVERDDVEIEHVRIYALPEGLRDE